MVSRRFAIALLSVWPGLAQIWTGQEVLGLILATLFSTTINLAIITRFVWTDVLASGWFEFFAAFASATWCLSFGYTVWWLWLCHPERHRAEIDRLYRDAQEAYLQGRWYDARRRLEQILTRDDTDADALMQLATLCIRTEQPDQARRALRQCQEQEGGSKWRWEIERALSRLKGG